MATIAPKFNKPPNHIWFTDEFRNVLEDHLIFLRNKKSTVINLEPMVKIKYRFDFFSLLKNHNIENYSHWIVMRMNGLNSPTDDFSELESLVIPDTTVLNQVLQHYVSRKRARGK